PLGLFCAGVALDRVQGQVLAAGAFEQSGALPRLRARMPVRDALEVAIAIGEPTIITADWGIHLTGAPSSEACLGRSHLGELNPRPAPMTLSYRSCSANMNSPYGGYRVPCDRRAVTVGNEATIWCPPNLALQLASATCPLKPACSCSFAADTFARPC